MNMAVAYPVLHQCPVTPRDNLPLALWTSAEIAAACGGTASHDFEASGVEMDSRDVKPGDVFVALKGEAMPSGTSVQDVLTNNIATIGENQSLRRAKRLEVSEGAVVAYVHNQQAPGLGKIGVLVAIDSDIADKDALMAIGKQIAMHVAAANPLAVEMLTGGLTEISMIWQDEITGVWVKARPDVLPPDVTELDADATARLDQLARKLGVTVGTVFQTAWGVLLGRLTGRPEPAPAPVAPSTAAQGLDEVLDGIDDVLEVNALTFVQSFRQKGGQ